MSGWFEKKGVSQGWGGMKVGKGGMRSLVYLVGETAVDGGSAIGSSKFGDNDFVWGCFDI